MTQHSWKQWIEDDRRHLWHPYTSAGDPPPVYPVISAEGNRFTLADGRELIDAMASWWCVIHGYRHPKLDAAIRKQLDKKAHVMFGGLTHQPAIELGNRLLSMMPGNFSHIFFADSGSVSVEVALKMAIQYHQARDQSAKKSFLALRGGYHGDTTGAMSVTDPEGGMHTVFSGFLPKHTFAPRPERRFGEALRPGDLDALESIFAENKDRLAAMIVEPIVQGAGGMWFYSAEYLEHFRMLCDRYEILLIVDEIATGFGRTGKLFAAEHAGVTPDIVCVGKALTGGYMTLAAVLAQHEVAMEISRDGLPLMHGPTFMANPLACSVALANLRLLEEGNWRSDLRRMENRLRKGLAKCAEKTNVDEVRVLGGIGVLDMIRPVDVVKAQAFFVERGVWIRPFRNLFYVMPPYITSNDDLDRITTVLSEAAEREDLLKKS